MKITMGKFLKKGERKINIQIDPYDTWNLDHTMAMIIYPALLQLKVVKHGVPSEFAEVGGEDWHNQLSFDFYTETVNESFELSSKKWDDILDKIIWSFQQLSVENEHDDKYHHGEIKISWTEEDRLGHSTMIDENPTEHWYDHVGHRLHEDRIQEGLELFGRYYRNLWD